MLIANLVAILSAARVLVSTWDILGMANLQISLLNIRCAILLSTTGLLFLSRWISGHTAAIASHWMLLPSFILLACGSDPIGGCGGDERLVLLLACDVAFLAALAAVVRQEHGVLVCSPNILLILLLEGRSLMRTLGTLRSFSQNWLDVSAHLDRVLLVNVVILLLQDLCLVQ